MFTDKYILKVTSSLMLVIALMGCSDKASTEVTDKNSTHEHQHALTPAHKSGEMPNSASAHDHMSHTSSMSSPLIVLDVHKSPTCSCCEGWINHINANGFESKVHSSQSFAVIKAEKGIAPQYRSCHTAVSKEGYIFEGHVPAKFIKQFMQEAQADNVLGLSVPAMPVGTPGMEVDDKFQPYQILLLTQDGSYEVYAKVNAYEEQF